MTGFKKIAIPAAASAAQKDKDPVAAGEAALPETVCYYLPCDDPTHPDGCQIKDTRCYTDRVCEDCPHNFHRSGIETHAETYEHTLAPSCSGKRCHSY